MSLIFSAFDKNFYLATEGRAQQVGNPTSYIYSVKADFLMFTFTA